MKKFLKHHIVPLIIRVLIQVVGVTWRVKIISRGEIEGGLVYAFWHRYIIPLAYIYRNNGVGIIISQSSDGESISKVVQSLGFKSIRGSSSRGGSNALRKIVKVLKHDERVAITPDGPRGPIYNADKGVAYVSLISDKPVVPVVVYTKSAIILKTWDKTLIPLPFAKIEVHLNKPIYPEKGLVVETYLTEIENTLREMEQKW